MVHLNKRKFASLLKKSIEGKSIRIAAKEMGLDSHSTLQRALEEKNISNDSFIKCFHYIYLNATTYSTYSYLVEDIILYGESNEKENAEV